MSRNKNGFTLIEVLIAIFLLLVGVMALLYVMSIAMSSNLQNVIRDEAVSVGIQQMTIVKNTPFVQLPAPGDNVSIGLSGSASADRTRKFRNTEVTYTVTTGIVQMSADTVRVRVLIEWSFKGIPYQHSVTSMMTRGA